MSGEGTIVYIVDDDESVRASLESLIQSVGLRAITFPSAQAFLDSPKDECPACLVLDVQLPGPSGLDLQAQLNAGGSAMPIIFITGRGDIPMTVRAMRAGAVEFLTKPFSEQELVAVIRHALARDRARRSEQKDLDELRRRYASLTPREREVMAHIVVGLLNKQIAAEFGTSEGTVKEQRAQVMLKMQASSVAGLVRIAERLGV